MTSDCIQTHTLTPESHTESEYAACSERCRETLRGHSESANAVVWVPYSNLLLSCSADKTLILWDARTVRSLTRSLLNSVLCCTQRTASSSFPFTFDCFEA